MLSKDKFFYKNFFSLMGMLAFQNMLVLAVNLIDTLMLSSYSEFALAGVGIVNQVQFIFQQLLSGAGDTLVVLGSQYWGQNRTQPIKKLTLGALILGCGFGIFLFILATVCPETIVTIFSENPEHISYGVEYLGIIRFTYLIFPISMVLLSSLRSVETVKIATYTSVMSLIINAVLNYFLIFGNAGFPEMGVSGAAVATLIARIAELAVIGFYVFKIDKKLKIKFQELIKPDKLMLRDYFKNCISFVAVATLFGFSTALQTVILGHIDTTNVVGDPIAANTLSSQLYMFLKVSAVGCASASAIVMGKTVGSNNLDKVKEYAKTLQIIFISIGVITGILLFFIRIPVLALSSMTPETNALTNNFLLIMCIISVGMSYQMPTLSGIIRGGGDTVFILKNDLISIWCIMLPISALAAFVFKWPPEAIVFCLNSDQIFKCGAAFFKCNSFNWVKKLTRSTEETGEISPNQTLSEESK